MKRIKFRILLIILIVINSKILNAEENSFSLKSIWSGISKQSGELLKSSIETFSGTLEKLNQTLDEEINYLREITEEKNKINILDKIDNIRLNIDEISNLKKKEESASSFTIISKSKKDYRIKIDNVLSEIEPILFDGVIVNYATKIRDVRENISILRSEKVVLNEKLLFAPKKWITFEIIKKGHTK